MRFMLFLLVALLTVAHAGEIKLTDQKLKEFKGGSVFIRVAAAKSEVSGSGFVFDAKAGELFLLTNHHVIDPSHTDDNMAGNVMVVAAPTITAVFGSGTTSEESLPATLICSAPMQDLAILSVKAPRQAGLAFPKQFKLRETDPLLIFGYPFGTALGVGERNPAITITKASVASLRRDEWGKLATIQIDGALNPGNSGGPVLDGKGQVIGVAVAAVRGAHVGFVIPVSTVTGLLDGQAVVVGSELMPSDRQGTNRFKIVVGFADPFAKLTSAKLYFNRVSDIPEKQPQLGDETAGWPKLTTQAETMSVQIRRGTKPFMYNGVTINAVGEAEIVLVGRKGEGEVEYQVQFETTHVQAAKRFSTPCRFVADFRNFLPSNQRGFRFASDEKEAKPAAEAKPEPEPAPAPTP